MENLTPINENIGDTPQKPVDYISTESEIPQNYMSLFQGNTSDVNFTLFFTNTTGQTHSFLIQNSFTSKERQKVFDISSYAIPGHVIYKVDVNISNNQVIAQDDWVHVNSQTSSNDYKIQNQSVSNTNEMLAQQITGNWRYQIKTISTYTLITNLFGNSNSTPKIQVWDNTSGTGDVPNQEQWSADLPLSQMPVAWINTSCDFIINASTPSNRSWYIVINGTDWANGVPNSAEWLSWMYGSGSGLRYKRWGSAWFPAPNSFCSLYKRLYLEDGSNSNRTFQPTDVNLALNGTTFNSAGRMSILGSNITALNISSNVTSVAVNVTIKLYYKKIISGLQAFSSDASSSVKWTLTSNSNITFPSSTDDWSFNVSKASSWTVTGVYNGEDASSAGSSTQNYTNYVIDGNTITVQGISANKTWQVRCESQNQMSDIIEFVNGSEVSSGNVTNIIGFNVSFSAAKSTGNVTIGVYYPNSVNNSLSFSVYNDSLGSAVNIVSFNNSWNVSENVLGPYRIQARWNTTDEVGYIKENFVIYGKMNITFEDIKQYNKNLGLAHPDEDFSNFSYKEDISNSPHWTFLNGGGNVTFKSEVINGNVKAHMIDDSTTNQGEAIYIFPQSSPGTPGNYTVSLELEVVNTGSNWVSVLIGDSGSNSRIYVRFNSVTGLIELPNGYDIGTWTTDVFYHLEFITVNSTHFDLRLNGTLHDNGGAHYPVYTQFSSSITRMTIYSHTTRTPELYFDNINVSWYQEDYYEGYHGDDVFMNYTILDSNNGSNINNLGYEFFIDGSSDNQGTSNNNNVSQYLNFKNRVIGTYNILVNFNRTYYHNNTFTYKIDIDACPTNINLINITQQGAFVYQNASDVYFVNPDSNFTISFNASNKFTNVLIAGMTANVTDGSNNYSNSSSNGVYRIDIDPTDLNPNSQLKLDCFADDRDHVMNLFNVLLYVDTNAPSSSITYTAASGLNYVNASTQFSLSANDGNDESGVAYIQYRIDSGSWNNYSSSFTLSSLNNGSHVIGYRAIDNSENVESENLETVLLDKNPPNTAISYVPAHSPNYINSSTLFTLTANDGSGESGVAGTAYRLNGGSWQTYTVPFTVASAGNGTVLIEYNSTDNVGNVESTGSLTVRLDTNAPNTSISYVPAHAPNYVNSSTLFTLTANDGGGESGVAGTVFRLNGGSWQTYSGPFTVASAGNGTVLIEYNSTDNVGNVEATGSITVRLDTNAPSTSISYTPAHAPNYVNSSTLFSLTANDGSGESGVASTVYRLNNGSWQAYTGPFTVASAGNGTVLIEYNSTDNVGNVEATGNITVRLDTNAPSTSISYTPA
ncbi:MAG: OmpL47-type beta-barrel domain-containing protein, partial [Promethearchaeota archaeon]